MTGNHEHLDLKDEVVVVTITTNEWLTFLQAAKRRERALKEE